MENAPVMQPAQHIRIHMDTLSYFGVPVDVLSIAATLLVGFIQVLAIMRGLAHMKQASAERDRQLKAQDRMLDAQDRKTDELISALRLQGEVLQTLLQRTEPPAPESATA